jgi:hypothetical protein
VAFKKSFRDINMKYNYIIENDAEFGIIIRENYFNKLFSENRRWTIKTLISKTDVYNEKSFNRTKQWVLENHPELLI